MARGACPIGHGRAGGEAVNIGSHSRQRSKRGAGAEEPHGISARRRFRRGRAWRGRSRASRSPEIPFHLGKVRGGDATGHHHVVVDVFDLSGHRPFRRARLGPSGRSSPRRTSRRRGLGASERPAPPRRRQLSLIRLGRLAGAATGGRVAPAVGVRRRQGLGPFVIASPQAGLAMQALQYGQAQGL
jgi:hypothetical protein